MQSEISAILEAFADYLCSINRSNSRVAMALDEFQRLLTPAQKAKLNSLSRGTPTTDDVVKFTKSIEEGPKKDKRRDIAARIYNFLQSLQQYCAIVDTLVSANPQTAGLIWGSMKFLILVSILCPTLYSPLTIILVVYEFYWVFGETLRIYGTGQQILPTA